MSPKKSGIPRISWKIARNGFLVFFLFFAQQLPGVSDAGVDLVLIFTVLAGLRTTLPRAVAWGAFLGFLQDALSAGWVGPHLVSKTLVGLLSSIAQKHTYREKVTTQSFLVLCMASLEQCLIWVLRRWDGTAPAFSDAFLVMEKTVLATFLAGILACFLIVRFRRRRMDPATA